MAYVATDEDGEEYVYEGKPRRREYTWICDSELCGLPKGSIKKLIGRTLTWADEAVELEEIKTTEETR